MPRVKKLDKASLKQAIDGGLRMPEMAWVETTPEQETFYVDTGKPQLEVTEQKALPEKGTKE